jgi:hypothetical protein
MLSNQAAGRFPVSGRMNKKEKIISTNQLLPGSYYNHAAFRLFRKSWNLADRLALAEHVC